MDERIRFIAANAEDPRGNFAQLCARFGISRTQGYKWVRRYLEQGPEGLRDRKPVAGRCPHRTAAEVESCVVELRKKYPHYGPSEAWADAAADASGARGAGGEHPRRHPGAQRS